MSSISTVRCTSLAAVGEARSLWLTPSPILKSAFLSLVGRVLPMQVDGRVELDVDVNVLAREAQLIDAAFSGLHMQGPKLIDAMAIELPESGDGREESNTDRRSTLEHVLDGD